MTAILMGALAVAIAVLLTVVVCHRRAAARGQSGLVVHTDAELRLLTQAALAALLEEAHRTLRQREGGDTP